MSESALVFGNACVHDASVVKGKARISENAVIKGHVIIERNASIRGRAFLKGNGMIVTEDAHIDGYAKILGNAYVGGNTVITDHATILGNATIEGSTYIGGEAILHKARRIEHPEGILIIGPIGKRKSHITINIPDKRFATCYANGTISELEEIANKEGDVEIQRIVPYIKGLVADRNRKIKSR